jgi:hypothetical protein
MNKYEYTGLANLENLNLEIIKSELPYQPYDIYVENNITIIEFNEVLSQFEVTILTQIFDDHDPTLLPSEQVMKVQFDKVSSVDKIPYVYATSKPIDYYVCFQGADDIPQTAEHDGIGMGNKLTFRMTSNQQQIVRDFRFNEDVYLKDGHIICKNCPFGATFSVDIIHPLAGLIQTFARNVPIYANAFIPLDTEDRALLPLGLIIRITINNSSGGISDNENESLYEDPPASFAMSARLELYRKKK